MHKTSNEAVLMLEAGHICRYAGRYSEARDIFQGVRALLPNREAPELALAALCMDECDYEAAVMHSRRALEVNRTCAEAYVQLAEIHLLRREFAAARENLEHCKRLKPHGPAAELANALAVFAALVHPRQRPAPVRTA